MNSLYGSQLGKDNNAFQNCKSEHWLQPEYDDILLDDWKLPNGNYIVEFKKHDGIDGDN